MFYYLIDLHYSQTKQLRGRTEKTVLLPYRFTLFSNCQSFHRKYQQFYYLIDLHYSQTAGGFESTITQFYYLIDLHYSQTNACIISTEQLVLLPYRFTLFSNRVVRKNRGAVVLLPYRFTLFSNVVCLRA